jgi:hypothetical protein
MNNQTHCPNEILQFGYTGANNRLRAMPKYDLIYLSNTYFTLHDFMSYLLQLCTPKHDLIYLSNTYFTLHDFMWYLLQLCTPTPVEQKRVRLHSPLLDNRLSSVTINEVIPISRK